MGGSFVRKTFDSPSFALSDPIRSASPCKQQAKKRGGKSLQIPLYSSFPSDPSKCPGMNTVAVQQQQQKDLSFVVLASRSFLQSFGPLQ